MKILVTGFEPFNNEVINPAEIIVNQLPSMVENAHIIKCILPTVAYKSIEIVEDILKHDDIDVVVSIGQAGGRANISLERVGININDFSIEDNAHQQYIDEVIFSDGKNAYFSSLPIKLIKKELTEAGYPIEISNTAGTFVCNHLFYGLGYLKDKYYSNLKVGFIHIPFADEQVINRTNVKSLDTKLMLNAIIKVLEVIVKNKNEIKEIGQGGLD